MTKDPAAILLVVAADHLIPDAEAFAAACRAALPAAAAGAIVTFGVKPTYPASSYGYIRPKPATNGSAVCKVEAFVEKPDEATAARYVADGYLWNSGNFMFRAEVMLARTGAPRAGDPRRRQGRRRRPDLPISTSSGSPKPPFAQAPKILDRLCGDGAHQARRGAAGRFPLVRHRQLECGLGRPARDDRRQRHRRARRRCSTPATA